MNITSRSLGLAILAAACLTAAGPARGQNDGDLLRAVSAPGRIDGQAAEKYRQAQAAMQASSAALAVAVPARPLTPAPAPSGSGWSVTALLSLCAFLALGVLAYTRFGKRPAPPVKAKATPAHAPETRGASPEELTAMFAREEERSWTAAARDEAKCAAIANGFLRSGKVKEFLARSCGRAPDYYDAYSRAFLRLGAWETAAAILRSKTPPDPKDAGFCEVLQLAARSRPKGAPAAGQAFEKVNVAGALAERGYGAEAFRLLSDEVLLAAMADKEQCLKVAAIYHAAGKGAEFAAQRIARRPGQFYRAYAQAFHALRDPETALALLQRKHPLEAQDYALLVACYKELGRIGPTAFFQVPDSDKLLLAQALTDAGEDVMALKTILEGRETALGEPDYTLALRICAKLNDFGAAARLFNDIRYTLPLEKSPELYYFYAYLCETSGRATEARHIYEMLVKHAPNYKDVAVRLNKIDGGPGA